METRVSILGVPVDNVTRAGAADLIASMLTGAGQHHVATPNPEMIVEAARNPEFKALLNRTSLNMPDGTGLLWAARRQGTPLRERVTGTDVMMDVCARVGGPVFLLGAMPGIAEYAAHALQTRNPALVIAGTFAGSPKPEHDDKIVTMINASGAPLLFVAYGAPKQELWIARNLSRMPGVRVAMGVGGAFDFLSGRRKRAPEFLRNSGLEWLFRLWQEPHRLGRIITATVTFPRMVVRASKN